MRGADLRNADLTDARLLGARYDDGTRLDDGFDPVAAGMLYVDEDQ
jgi:hypothetical protein